jgi:hypothetical protein
MSIQLRVRIALITLIGAFLVVSLGTALQFRQLALAAERLVATAAGDAIASQATTAAVGLGLVGVLALLAGALVTRAFQTGFLDRLYELELAALDIEQGDDARRVPVLGDDELARIARALNLALDNHDRDVAELRGRNREMRALLVALLRQWDGSVAITGIDGELLASTLLPEDEQRLRDLTPQLRKAASLLLARGFVSPSELTTDITFAAGGVLHIRALALGEQRIVGWLAAFDDVRRTELPAVPADIEDVARA